MKHKNFCGVAVHPANVSPKEGTLIGVCLRQEISSSQRATLMHPDNLPKQGGHVGVHAIPMGTVVKFVGRGIKDAKEARQIAIHLMRTVASITGAHSILRRLSRREIGRAFAP